MLWAQRQRFAIQQQAWRDIRFVGGRGQSAKIEAQDGIGMRPGAAAQGHHQSAMFTGVTRDAKILVITGYLPVRKGLLRGRGPQQAGRNQAEQEKENNAIAHGR